MSPYIYYGTTLNPEIIKPEDILQAYASGFFPMGDGDGSVSWYDHRPRSVIPLDNDFFINISRSLKQVLNKKIFEIKFNCDFRGVINECASSHGETWITPEIIFQYTRLHNLGYAHSVEAYKNGILAGGLYGVAYKGAFFGESMFYRESNASKVAFTALYDVLKKNRYILLDTQMMTPLMKSFGAVLIDKNKYLLLLKKAMRVNRIFKYSS